MSVTSDVRIFPEDTQSSVSESHGRWQKIQRLFSRRPPETSRTVQAGHTDSVNSGEDTRQYPDNKIVSSKYTVLTFLPKNLFEQFRRVANFYFLAVGIVQLLIDTPVTPVTSIAPLVFVVSVTAIKQGYEDWLRHKADNEVNLRTTTLVRNGQLDTDCRSMDIKVGDIVRVSANEEFPCDLVLLSSSDPQGNSYVTTANLDGETNLKTHVCISDTRKLQTPQALWNSHIIITCNPPLPDLYTFEGVMQVGEFEPKPLSLQNILLRGARLKNTPHIFGCAVYTGCETKMALNSKPKQMKTSRVEKTMNTFLIVYLLLLLFETMLCTILSYWHEDNNPDNWFLDERSRYSEPKEFLERFLSFMVLFNYIVPISLYVSVELQKFVGSLFFLWDVEMYDETIDERAQVNTSDLNEELGQVEYLFSDKTGTLTENNMVFRRCCINDRKFEEVRGELCERMDSQIDPVGDVVFIPEMDNFFQVLALCHTVRVDVKDKGIIQNGGSHSYSQTGKEYEYQASSPDEKAFVEACCRYGIIYHGINDDLMEVSFRGKMRRFKLLHTLHFDPTRKRMSVIIKDEEENVILYTKGAEVAILDRVISGDITTTQEMINEYAALGLRTLTIAQKPLTPEEFNSFNEDLKNAQRALTDREKKLSIMYNEIEQQLTLLGATAVEDKLQEKVPETIVALRLAGIKVWVLTGDKEETATNISYSAGHFHPSMKEIRVTQVNSDEHCEELILHALQIVSLATPGETFALIIDGQSLTYALKLNKVWLRQLGEKCAAVLCCRMSPLHKSQVVALIKESPDKPVTAAIGDGANDVSMIQEADVGLGIMGKEGRQAVRNSDYAFGKFRFLHRALLYHGHLYYSRLATMVQYFFYKNLAWITSQVFFAMFSAYSQESLFDPFYLIFYNIAFTSLPILVYGLFEQPKAQDTLLKNPEIYRTLSRNSLLSWKEFVKWNVLALWHACVIYFGVMGVLWDGIPIHYNGLVVGETSFGSLVYFSSVMVSNLKLMIETYYFCIPTIGTFLFTICALIGTTAVYANVFWPSWMTDRNDLYKILNKLFDGLTPWLTILLVIVAALLPDLVIRAVKDCLWQYEQHQRDLAKNQKSKGLKLTPVASFPSPQRGNINQFELGPNKEGNPEEENVCEADDIESNLDGCYSVDNEAVSGSVSVPTNNSWPITAPSDHSSSEETFSYPPLEPHEVAFSGMAIEDSRAGGVDNKAFIPDVL